MSTLGVVDILTGIAIVIILATTFWLGVEKGRDDERKLWQRRAVREHARNVRR